MDLPAFRRDAEPLSRALAEAQLDRLLGRAAPEPTHEIYSRFSVFRSREPVLAARERFSALKPDAPPDEGPAQAANVLAFTARHFDAAFRAQAFDAAREAEGSATVLLEGEARRLVTGERWVGREDERDNRAAGAQAVASAYGRLERPRSRWVAEAQDVAGALDFPGYEQLVSATEQLDVPALAEEAQALLRQTEDAYRDLAAYAFKRVGIRAGLKPRGEGAWHDLVRLHRLEPLDDHFPSRRLPMLRDALLAELGLATERIELAEEPARRRGVSVAVVDAPEEVVVAFQRWGGVSDFAAALHGTGVALRYAHADARLPFEERALTDATVEAAFGLVFERLLLDPGFLKKRLDIEPKDGLEAARLIAIDRLRALRQNAAQLVYERALYKEGPTADLKPFHREQLGRAMLVDWPADLWLSSVQPRFACAHALRGAALEALLHRALLDTADEDHWRNPRMGRFLLDLYKRAGTLMAPSLAQQLGGTLGLAQAARRLVEVAAR